MRCEPELSFYRVGEVESRERRRFDSADVQKDRKHAVVWCFLFFFSCECGNFCRRRCESVGGDAPKCGGVPPPPARPCVNCLPPLQAVTWLHLWRHPRNGAFFPSLLSLTLSGFEPQQVEKTLNFFSVIYNNSTGTVFLRNGFKICRPAFLNWWVEV